jgi:oxygen-independent coproporphyrinogen-3 oxidase
MDGAVRSPVTKGLSVATGLYISVPFCRTKCSYCNFASGVFSREKYARYVDRVCADMAQAPQIAACVDGKVEREADSVFMGGGTPTILEPEQLERLFTAVRQNFDVARDAEITVECAPGTLSQPVIDLLLRCGVNRVSLGVQSFVDKEAAAVGRLHTRATVLEEIARLRASGIENINLDLIAGLPHQTVESWKYSVDEVIATSAPHVSVYMLEVDEDSRLGRELIAGGNRYHAHFVPNDEVTADFYEFACDRLNAAGTLQYEISNFATPSAESKHNLKYWTRGPYFGFGVDAHSMVRPNLTLLAAGVDALRFWMPSSLEEFIARPDDWGPPDEIISRSSALEETFFLGLRLNRGVRLRDVEGAFGDGEVAELEPIIGELVRNGLLSRHDDLLRLTPRGRLLSNEVFEAFVSIGSIEDPPELMGFVKANPASEGPRLISKQVH